MGSLAEHGRAWRVAGGSGAQQLLRRAVTAATTRLVTRAARVASDVDGTALVVVLNVLNHDEAALAEQCVAAGLVRALAQLVLRVGDGRLAGMISQLLHVLPGVPRVRGALFEGFVDDARTLQRFVALAGDAVEEADAVTHVLQFVIAALDGALGGAVDAPGAARNDMAHYATALMRAGASSLLLRALAAYTTDIKLGQSVASACGALCRGSEEAIAELVAGGALPLTVATARTLAGALADKKNAPPGASEFLHTGFFFVCSCLVRLLRDCEATAGAAGAFVSAGGAREIAGAHIRRRRAVRREWRRGTQPVRRARRRRPRGAARTRGVGDRRV